MQAAVGLRTRAHGTWLQGSGCTSKEARHFSWNSHGRPTSVAEGGENSVMTASSTLRLATRPPLPPAPAAASRSCTPSLLDLGSAMQSSLKVNVLLH